MKYYAGIGARITPPEILNAMYSAAKAMAQANVVLRTGGSSGADQAFYDGLTKIKGESPTELLELYPPYEGFNGFRYNGKTIFGPPTTEARLMAKEYHPNWGMLGDLGRDFHARNCYQVLGFDLKTPADFIICWTPNGKPVGGTAQAIRIAEKYNIPVFNLSSIDLPTASNKIMDIISA